MRKKPNSYRVRNWAEYNVGLKQRGRITFWLDEAAVKTWLNQEKTGKRGASYSYSDLAIETVVMIKSVYSLAGRQAVGFVESVFALLAVDLAVPEHSTVSRRLANVNIELSVRPKAEARHVVIDATGIKIYGGLARTARSPAGAARPWL